MRWATVILLSWYFSSPVAAGLTSDVETLFSGRDVLDGVSLTQAECDVWIGMQEAVWVTVDGKPDCIRYYHSDLSEPKQALIFMSGDALSSSGVASHVDLPVPAYLENKGASGLRRYVQNQSRQLGVPYIFLGRPGLYGSSGRHADRRQRREIAVVAEAIKAIRARHQIARIAVAGQSGGALLTAAMLTRVPDLTCAVSASGPLHLARAYSILHKRTDTRGGQVVDPYDDVDEVRPGGQIWALADPRDEVVPPGSAKSYITALRKRGIPAEMWEAKAASGDKFHNLAPYATKAAALCLQGNDPAAIRVALDELATRPR